MVKGLEREYQNELKIKRVTQHFERKFLKTKCPVNKSQILDQLLNTAANNTYLKRLKQEGKQIDKELEKQGINLDLYRVFAQSMVNAYKFKKERVPLI